MLQERKLLFSVSHLERRTRVLGDNTDRFPGTDGADALVRAKQGFDMISANTDVGVIGAGMTAALRMANGETVQESGPGDY